MGKSKVAILIQRQREDDALRRAGAGGNGAFFRLAVGGDSFDLIVGGTGLQDAAGAGVPTEIGEGAAAGGYDETAS